jgi:hypothetical protein
MLKELDEYGGSNISDMAFINEAFKSEDSEGESVVSKLITFEDEHL